MREESHKLFCWTRNESLKMVFQTLIGLLLACSVVGQSEEELLQKIQQRNSRLKIPTTPRAPLTPIEAAPSKASTTLDVSQVIGVEKLVSTSLAAALQNPDVSCVSQSLQGHTACVATLDDSEMVILPPSAVDWS